MKRAIEKRLIDWKNTPNHKPLIIKGARQVGKTYTIRQFAKENYHSFIEINFERDVSMVHLFSKTRNPSEIIELLKISYLNTPINQNTLLFLDEIQACPDALTSLKFLAEDFPCDIICSGSMLGIAIAKSTSFPVGYVETWDMFPFSFSEFLLACGIEHSFLERINHHLKTLTPISDALHDKMNELFTNYMICGGMPEVVKTYIQTKSFREVLLVQRRIVNDYLNDMAKYAESKDKIRARECYSSIPVQLAKENKKFQYSVIQKGYNARHYDSSLKWLADSGLILQAHRLSHIARPIRAYCELAIFKVYASDTGLFISQMDDGDIAQLIQGNLGIFQGAVYENMAAQTLERFQKKFYYYEPSQNSEIDFIIEYEGNITPVEVKSSKHTTSISFNNFVKKYSPEKAFRFSKKNIGYSESEKIYFIPFYLMEFVLKQEKSIF